MLRSFWRYLCGNGDVYLSETGRMRVQAIADDAELIATADETPRGKRTVIEGPAVRPNRYREPV